jgi:hypothetical protein
MDAFLHWLALKASSLPNQVHFNKNQLQELLLGVALFLRDLELSCFVDHKETPIPPFLINSCMEVTDVDPIGEVVETILRAMEEQSK